MRETYALTSKHLAFGNEKKDYPCVHSSELSVAVGGASMPSMASLNRQGQVARQEVKSQQGPSWCQTTDLC